MDFPKPFQTIQQQIDILTQRGLIIDDNAEFYLQHINYYRLAGYSLPFQEDPKTHAFKPNTKFSHILNLYIFDREFRLLLLDAIERIEISVKTHWAYCFSKSHGPHAYLDCSLSNNVHWHAQNLVFLEKERNRSDEIFIAHFSKADANPPIWAICEIMSFGMLSRWLKCLKPTSCRNEIARSYSLDYSVLISFIEHLSYLRNLCAHHSRVWNKKMTKTMQIPKSKPQSLIPNFTMNTESQRKIYNTLVMIIYLLGIISPDNHFKERMISLLNVHAIDSTLMGFPENWRNQDIWSRSFNDQLSRNT